MDKKTMINMLENKIDEYERRIRMNTEEEIRYRTKSQVLLEEIDFIKEILKSISSSNT